jgi:hypothetical protein
MGEIVASFAAVCCRVYRFVEFRARTRSHTHVFALCKPFFFFFFFFFSTQKKKKTKKTLKKSEDESSTVGHFVAENVTFRIDANVDDENAINLAVGQVLLFADVELRTRLIQRNAQAVHDRCFY